MKILYPLHPLGGTFTKLQRQNPSKLQVVNSKSRRRAEELNGKCLKLGFITFSDFLVNCKFHWTLSGTGAEFRKRCSVSVDVNGKMILEISTTLSYTALRISGVTAVEPLDLIFPLFQRVKSALSIILPVNLMAFGSLFQPCSLECFLWLSECQLSHRSSSNREFGKKNDGGSGPEISVEVSNTPLRDGKTKGDGQAGAVNVLSDQKTSWQGLCFPWLEGIQPQDATWGTAGSSSPGVHGAPCLGYFGWWGAKGAVPFVDLSQYAPARVHFAYNSCYFRGWRKTVPPPWNICLEHYGRAVWSSRGFQQCVGFPALYPCSVLRHRKPWIWMSSGHQQQQNHPWLFVGAALLLFFIFNESWTHHKILLGVYANKIN